VLLVDLDGIFQAFVTYGSGDNNSGIFALSVAVADVNGDGRPDIVVANEGSGTVDVLLGNGDGALSSSSRLRCRRVC
jgi:hypothetical protein